MKIYYYYYYEIDQYGILHFTTRKVDQRPSPARGNTMVTSPSLITIHYTADDNPQSTINTFTHSSAKISAHFLVDRAGNITQFVEPNTIAWHAGVSEWKSKCAANNWAIGIEITNTGWLPTSTERLKNTPHPYAPEFQDFEKYTFSQLESLKELIEVLKVKFPSIIETVGHEDIAIYSGRKQDPGPAFPWHQGNFSPRPPLRSKPEKGELCVVASSDAELFRSRSTHTTEKLVNVPQSSKIEIVTCSTTDSDTCSDPNPIWWKVLYVDNAGKIWEGWMRRNNIAWNIFN